MMADAPIRRPQYGDLQSRRIAAEEALRQRRMDGGKPPEQPPAPAEEAT